MLKNPRHEIFAQELAQGKNASEAYRIAGYNDNRSAACRLQQDVRIQERLNQLLAERARRHAKASERAVEKLAISREWVLGKLVENVERGLQARAVLDDDGNPVGDYKYDGSVVNKALELLGIEQGMFIKRSESGAPGEFAGMNTPAEVLEELRKLVGDELAGKLANGLDEQPSSEPDLTHPGSDSVN